MTLARGAKRRAHGFDYWPGFVDALATLLLVTTFLLSVFMVGQYLLSREVTGQESLLSQLERQISELSQLLALERREKADLQVMMATLSDSIDRAREDKKKLESLLEGSREGEEDALQAQRALEEEKNLSAEARDEVLRLNQQLAAMRRQLASLQTALEASEERDQKSQARIADLGRRLNTALAQKVQELSRYRSAFFAALRDILKDRQDFRIVGDRFILQSEVLFESGSAKITPRGRWELRKVADTLKDVSRDMPTDFPWFLRVDGHTDAAPIKTEAFPSNWELSAARALSVVNYLIVQGIAPHRLIAAGFGEFRPLDKSESPESYRLNRRIEFKLTEG